MFKHAVILAAGRGERMKPVTDYIPKALYIKNGYPLINRVISSLPANISLSVTYCWLGKKILNKLSKHKDISFIHTNGGNAEVLNSIIKYINQPIIVVPCDISFNINWKNVYEEFRDRHSIHMIIPVKTEYEGDYIHSVNGKVERIGRVYPSSIKASGIQILIPSKIIPINHFTNFNEIWNYSIKRNKLDLSENTPYQWEAVDYV